MNSSNGKARSACLVVGFESVAAGTAVESFLHLEGFGEILHLRRWPTNEDLGSSSLSMTSQEYSLHYICEYGLERYGYSGRDCDDALLGDDLDAHLLEMVVMFSRYRHLRNISSLLRDPYDIYMHSKQMIRSWCEVFEAKQVGLLVFDRFPHSPADYAAHLAASTVGIPEMMCLQSILPGFFRIFSGCDARNSAAVLAPSGDGASRSGNSPERSSEMIVPEDTVPPDPVSTRRVGLGSRVSLMPRFRRITRSFITEDLAIWRSLPGASRSELLNLRLSRARTVVSSVLSGRLRHRPLSARHKQTILRRDSGQFDAAFADGSFVYFPLHVWPEMALLPLGGMWFDQLDALEALAGAARDLGLGLIAKEHPDQHASNRSRLWWNRLAGIRNLLLAPESLPSLRLIEQAAVVATVTGTAAYEAFQRGTGVVVFGNDASADLPGVFRVASASVSSVRRALSDAAEYTKLQTREGHELIPIPVSSFSGLRTGWVSTQEATRAAVGDWFGEPDHMSILIDSLASGYRALNPSAQSESGREANVSTTLSSFEVRGRERQD